jgi:indole-3-glycerol phosphate synthase
MSRFVETGTVLDRILARTSADVAERRQTISEAQLERAGAGRPEPVSLRAALSGPGVSVISEIKRASPSRGVFPVEVDPSTVAAAYLDGGAGALSILTDEPFFRGSLADLRAGASVAHGRISPAPVLRKDFMVDDYQVLEAWANGADAILLIVAALDDETIRSLSAAARSLGMDALVEVHDERELERALAAGATLVGVNNRDLHTFNVDLATTERVASALPPGVTLVAESGVFTRDDVRRLEAAGASAVLVGEGLIVQPDRSAAVRALLGTA